MTDFLKITMFHKNRKKVSFSTYSVLFDLLSASILPQRTSKKAQSFTKRLQIMFLAKALRKIFGFSDTLSTVN